MAEISVIVPVYRAEDTLRRTVESVLAQTFSDYELLLVDDGSPDGTGALCDELALADSRVRVMHLENGGVSAARNAGMDRARGRYFAFLDADDYFAPETLEVLHQLVKENKADSAGCAHWKLELDGEKRVERAALPKGLYDEGDIREGIVNRLVGERLGKTKDILNGFIWRYLFDASIVRRQKIRFIGPYLEDELFLIEYFCQAKLLAMTDAPLYYYFQNPKSVTRNYLPGYIEYFTKFMQQKEKLVTRFELDNARPQWRENSNWAGLLIAVANEYAPGNKKKSKDKLRRVKAICNRPEMSFAMERLYPRGLSRNKQTVANLLRKHRFRTLGLLYAIKNR